MMKSGKAYQALRSASRRQQLRASFAVGRTSCQRAPHLEARTGRSGNAFGTDHAHEDVRHAIGPPLLSLANIVQQRRHEQVWLCVSACDEPSSGVGAVHDVAWVLRAKQVEQLRRQVRLGDRIVRRPGGP